MSESSLVCLVFFRAKLVLSICRELRMMSPCRRWLAQRTGTQHQLLGTCAGQDGSHGSLRLPPLCHKYVSLRVDSQLATLVHFPPVYAQSGAGLLLR